MLILAQTLVLDAGQRDRVLHRIGDGRQIAGQSAGLYVREAAVPFRAQHELAELGDCRSQWHACALVDVPSCRRVHRGCSSADPACETPPTTGASDVLCRSSAVFSSHHAWRAFLRRPKQVGCGTLVGHFTLFHLCP